ncbi:hypothetical protein LINPERPRIM_LOCUS37980 [Linum perenne]
MQPSIQHWL